MTADFSKSFITSALLHVALLFIVLTRVLFAPTNIPLEIRHAIRVDVVGLPDKIMEAPAPTPVAAPPPAVTAPKVHELPKKEAPPKLETKPTVNINAKKADLAKNQKKALEQLKAMDALERIKSEVSAEKRREKIGQIIKGARVNQGTSLTGLEKIDFDRYFDQMESHLREHWNLPQWLEDASFKAQALVVLDENGNVIRKQLVKSSGNSVFDANVLDAIDKSSPFPAPPQRLQGVLSTRGVVFNFPEE
jgi:colicin import membrane protein